MVVTAPLTHAGLSRWLYRVSDPHPNTTPPLPPISEPPSGSNTATTSEPTAQGEHARVSGNDGTCCHPARVSRRPTPLSSHGPDPTGGRLSRDRVRRSQWAIPATGVFPSRECSDHTGSRSSPAVINTEEGDLLWASPGWEGAGRVDGSADTAAPATPPGGETAAPANDPEPSRHLAHQAERSTPMSTDRSDAPCSAGYGQRCPRWWFSYPRPSSG